MALATPVSAAVTKQLFKVRAKVMVWTDKRANILQELLGGMRIIKFFAWEIPFIQKVTEYRKQEIQ